VDPASPGWAVERALQRPAEVHERPWPDPLRRTVWVCEPTEPALVLGSGQADDVVDASACERAGVAVVRRRSGGGAVLGEPGRVLWLDVFLPADDALWDGDVGRAFLWLGEVWAAALRDLGVDAIVHRGGLESTAWSPLVCFGGVGTGEVLAPSGAKLVGISQRRTRAGARFQCQALGAWAPEDLLALLDLSPEERAAATVDLAQRAAPVGVDLDALHTGVLAHLP
jgi:lipoate-protein ligase A